MVQWINPDGTKLLLTDAFGINQFKELIERQKNIHRIILLNHNGQHNEAQSLEQYLISTTFVVDYDWWLKKNLNSGINEYQISKSITGDKYANKMILDNDYNYLPIYFNKNQTLHDAIISQLISN